MRSEARVLRGLLAALVALSLGAASAQYDVRPFEDDPVAISAAFGAEMAVLRLQAAEALFEAGAREDEVEEVLEGLELEWLRMGAAVTEADAELAAELEEALEALEGAQDPAAAVSEALPLALRARDAVSAPLVEDPAYAGAIMTLLLVSETGVAEGWEEAAEGEVGPYAVGWAGMPRLYELWETLKPLANENQTFEIEDQLGSLQALFENPTPPNMEGADPEEGEGAAVHVAGFLEDVTGAWLFPDRDLPALVDRTRTVATEGCAAYAAGDELRGDARMAWTAFAFGEYLGGTLSLFAPEPTEEIEALLSPLAGEEEEEEGEEGEEDETAGADGAAADADEADADAADAGDVDGDDVDADDADATEEAGAFDPAASCGPLLDAFDEVGAAFGL